MSNMSNRQFWALQWRRVCAACNRLDKEHLALHEAAHMLMVERFYPDLHPHYHCKIYDGKYYHKYHAAVAHDYVKETDDDIHLDRRNLAQVAMAGDIAVAMEIGIDDIPAFAKETFGWYDKGAHGDWDCARNLLGKGNDALACYLANETWGYLDEHWNELLEEQRLALTFLDPFHRIPLLVRYLDSGDQRIISKIMGGVYNEQDLADLRKRLLDPSECYDTCRRLGTVYEYDDIFKGDD